MGAYNGMPIAGDSRQPRMEKMMVSSTNVQYTHIAAVEVTVSILAIKSTRAWDRDNVVGLMHSYKQGQTRCCVTVTGT